MKLQWAIVNENNHVIDDHGSSLMSDDRAYLERILSDNNGLMLDHYEQVNGPVRIARVLHYRRWKPPLVMWGWLHRKRDIEAGKREANRRIAMGHLYDEVHSVKRLLIEAQHHTL